MNKKQLINEAKKAMKNSYSIYSKFAVGAAVLTNDNKIFYGTNIENCSLSLTMCAERIAVFSCYANGYKKKDIKALAIVSKGKDIAYPCGACRQTLSELISMDTPIYLSNLKDKEVETNLKEILPYPFDKNYLK